MSVKITRTMNNTLIVGETKETAKQVTIQDPYGMIPMEEGIRLVPLDIEITGFKMPEITLTQDKVMYTTDISEIIIAEYHKLLEQGVEAEVNLPEDTETSEPVEGCGTCS